MPSFGKRSQQMLDTVHPDLQEIMNEVIKIYDVSIICGHRTEAEQNAAFRTGKSKLKFPYSKHNSVPSMAVDIIPYPVDWNDSSRFYFLAGLIFAIAHEKGIKIRWGGDWDGDFDFDDQKFNDLPHFELI